MATPMRLDEALLRIMDALEARLEEQRQTLLADFRSIIHGDRTRVGFDLPALWVLYETATNTGPHALQEGWEMPVTLAAVLSGDEPDLAYRDAIRLAARARSAALRYDDDRRYRRLDLPFVDDLQSQAFEPARVTPVDNRTLYGAAAVIVVRFRTFERS